MVCFLAMAQGNLLFHENVSHRPHIAARRTAFVRSRVGIDRGFGWEETSMVWYGGTIPLIDRTTMRVLRSGIVRTNGKKEAREHTKEDASSCKGSLPYSPILPSLLFFRSHILPLPIGLWTSCIDCSTLKLCGTSRPRHELLLGRRRV